MERIQRHIKDQKTVGLQIPKVQKRPVEKTIRDYEQMSKGRDEAIVRAYASGAYSYQELGDYFGLHFTRIGRIVRNSREAKS